MKIRFACALVAFAVAGCATEPPPVMVWLRTDGKLGDDPVFAHQFKMDHMVCGGDTGKAALSGLNPVMPYRGSYSGAIEEERAMLSNSVMLGCMAEKGYVLVRQEERFQKAAELEALAAEKARREAAAKQPPASAKRTNPPRPQVAEVR